MPLGPVTPRVTPLFARGHLRATRAHATIATDPPPRYIDELARVDLAVA